MMIVLGFSDLVIYQSNIKLLLKTLNMCFNVAACALQCSVTCGEGQQTRDVICVGPHGEHLADHACSGLSRPPSVQACRRPACYTHITWHVTEYGLVSGEPKSEKPSSHWSSLYCSASPLSFQCTRSCGGGVRERRVSCFDTDLNPYPEDRCGADGRPISVESCNAQACPGAQRASDLNPGFNILLKYCLFWINRLLFSVVPSAQDPSTHEGTLRGYVPHVPEEGMKNLWKLLFSL